MGTVYSQWQSADYGFTGKTRCYNTANTSSNNTHTTVTVEGAVQSHETYNMSLYGVECQVGHAAANGVGADWASTTGRMDYTNWVAYKSASYTFPRETYDYSVSVWTKYLGNNLGGAATGIKQADELYQSVTIPALQSYAITYNADGGTGAPSNQTKYYGRDINLSATVPTKPKYTFLGWSSRKGGSVEYAPGARYSANAGIELFAVWKLAYADPSISGLTVARCYSNGSISKTGNYVKVDFQWRLDNALTLASGTVTCGDVSVPISAVSAASGTVSKIVGGALSPLSSYNVTAKIVDSAGLTKTASTTLSKETYEHPTASNIKAVRTNASWVESNEGTCGMVTFSWTVHPMGGYNMMQTITAEYREHNTNGAYTSATVTKSGTASGTATVKISGGVLNPGKSYDVRIVMTDKVSSGATSAVVPPSVYTVDFKAGGRGIAIGKAASEDDMLEIDFRTRFNKDAFADGDMHIGKQHGIYGYNSNGARTNGYVLCPRNDKNEMVVNAGGYTDGNSDTNLMGKNVSVNVKGAFNITSPTAGLRNRAYGVNKILWSGALYMHSTHTVSLSEPISAQPHGIVLSWSQYDKSGGTAANQNCIYNFIPKHHVNGTGGNSGVALAGFSDDAIMIKYLYVRDTEIRGYSGNENPNRNIFGITINNQFYVLRYVIGV